MKNRNKFEVLTVVLFIAVSIMCGNGLHAQSLKKTFKYIKEGEIAKADIEVQEFKSDQKTSVEDLMLYGLASCLIICNENYQNYDPYKSLELFKTTAEANANKAEVDEFLGKYELSITKVQEIIYQSIFSQAQKINTEKTYEKALSVCQCGIIQSPKTNTASSFKKAVIVYQYCFYKDEAIKLKEEAAYNESKKKGSVEGCKYFIGAYPKSEHVTEINNLLYGLAFQNAKANISLSSMDVYLKEYSNNSNTYIPIATNIRDSLAFSFAQKSNTFIDYDNYILTYSSINNKYLPLAINIRDSIAFNSLNKNYSDYQNFVKKYPNSKYLNRVKGDFANLLFDEANKTRKIYLFEQFLAQYPNDARKDSVNIKLEKLYFEKLKGKPTTKSKEFFKNRFPNSPDLNLVDALVSKDFGEQELTGKVKSTKSRQYIVYYPKSNTSDDSPAIDLYNHFNKNGNLIENGIYMADGSFIRIGTVKYDENENIVEESSYQPDGSLENRSTYKYDKDENVLDESNYQSDGSLKNRKTYKYDDQGNMIEKCEYQEDGSFNKNTYDANENLLEECDYNKDGSIKSKGKYMGGVEFDYCSYYQNGKIKYQKKSDDKNNPIEFNFYSPEGRVETKHFKKYDAQGNKTEEIYYREDGSIGERTNYKYDYLGKLIEKIDYLDVSQNSGRTTFKYNINGDISEECEYYGAQENYNKMKTYKYDDKRNKIEECYYDKDANCTGKRLFYNQGKEYTTEHYSNWKKSDGSMDKKTTIIYDSKGQFMELIIRYADGKIEKKPALIYDAKGKVIEKNVYTENLSHPTRDVYQYDAKGNKIEDCCYNHWESLAYKYTYKYDEQGNEIEAFYSGFEYQKLANTLRYKKGHLIEENHYKKDGSMDYKYIYTYGDNWKVLYVTIYSGDGKNEKWYAERFDTKGYKTEECNFKYEGRNVFIGKRRTFINDENGNWLEKSERDGPEIGTYYYYVTKRTIEYYQ